MKKLGAFIFFAVPFFFSDALQVTTSDNIQLNVQSWPAQHPKGVVVYIHSLKGHVGSFKDGPFLARNGYTVYAFDRRGSGRSTGMRGHVSSPTDFYKDLSAVLKFVEKRNISRRPLHILGNSLGATIAMTYLLHNSLPNLASVILSAPGFWPRRQAAYNLFEKLDIIFSPAKQYHPSSTNDLQLVGNQPAVLRRMGNDPLRQHVFTSAFMKSLNNMHGQLKYTSQLDTPILLVLAKKDQVVDNDKCLRRFYELYRGYKKLVQLDCEHYICQTEKHQELMEEILLWLNRRS